MMWGYGWNGAMFPWMIVVGLFWLAVLGVLIWALARLVSHRAQPNTLPPVGSGPTALDILRQRFARGEIDATTFEQMRERLEGSATITSKPGDGGQLTTL